MPHPHTQDSIDDYRINMTTNPIFVQTSNGIYSATVLSDGSVRQTVRNGRIHDAYFASENAWRATICDISIREIGALFGRISHGDTWDDEAVVDATNALNLLLTVDADLLRRSFEQTKGLWLAASSAAVTWASIPTMVVKAHKLIDRCEEVLTEVYSDIVATSLEQIENNNDSMWAPLATELLTFIQQPCFRFRLDCPHERIMVRAYVRRWMSWSSNDALLEACRVFLAAIV